MIRSYDKNNKLRRELSPRQILDLHISRIGSYKAQRQWVQILKSMFQGEKLSWRQIYKIEGSLHLNKSILLLQVLSNAPDSESGDDIEWVFQNQTAITCNVFLEIVIPLIFSIE